MYRNLKTAIFSLNMSVQGFAKVLGWLTPKLSKIMNNKQPATFLEECQIINALNKKIASKGIDKTYSYESIFMKAMPQEVKIFFKSVAKK